VDVTKSNITMGTKLKRITHLSCQDAQAEFKWLMPHFSVENLIGCFNELDGKKAVGTDGCRKEDYARDLEKNIQELVRKMKVLSYRPAPVKEVLIPKSNGKFRPLGISNFEDKIIQAMFCKILEAIYEPIFNDCSYGFRRNKSAHMAIQDAIEYLKFNNVKEVIDVDLENFFGTIRHDELLRMLSLKIKDKTFLRYIVRMLKAGIITKEGLKESDVGLPQGSILSPVLANIYAHYVIDLWFKKVVSKHIIGKVEIFRYCDDLIVCATDTRDINKIIRSLDKRLNKFGLKVNLEKTKTVKFNRYTFERGEKQESFDFLGFTFYLSRARAGFVTIKVKTSKKTMRAKLTNVKTWIRLNRFKGTLLEIWLEFCKKIQGHIVYYGVSNNGVSISKFIEKARKIFFKWINRRSQKRSLNWEQFSNFEKQYPLPKVKIYHQDYKSV
jgi:RNA-directed DNA polymerase